MSQEEKPKPKPQISLEEKDSYRKRLFGVVSHIENVQQAAKVLATQLIEEAETKEDLDMARRLIQRAQKHDLSKFEGIEWNNLHRGDDLIKTAIEQHQQVNDHHPEYFVGGIKQMNDLQLAEMLCDCKARSSEFGTDLRDWVKNKATEKYDFTTKSVVYRKLKRFLDLLLDPKF